MNTLDEFNELIVLLTEGRNWTNEERRLYDKLAYYFETHL